MRLEGSLDAFSLPDIFSLLSMTKKTGGLHLRRGDAHGAVWFTAGSLTGGTSDVGRQSLARRLVGRGGVDAGQLEQALDAAADDDQLGIVRALVQTGAVAEEALHDVVREHVVDTVFALLRWPDGDFAFVVDEANPDDVGVRSESEDVVVAARQRLESWNALPKSAPAPDAVLALTLNPETDPDLTPDQWSLLALLDGRRRVRDVVALSGQGDFAVVTALADLVQRGLVRADDAGTVAVLSRLDALLATAEPARAEPAEQPATRPASSRSPEPARPQETQRSYEPPRAVEPVETWTDVDAGHPTSGGLGGTRDLSALRSVGRPISVSADRAPLSSVPDPEATRDRTEVTPQRPEPFLPPRQPEHPEIPPPAVAVAGGGSALAVSPTIERDPSVNKSLLLRLIAGVRGL